MLKTFHSARRSSLIAAALLSSVAVVHAADITIPPMPEPVVVDDWSGFYAGVTAGYAFDGEEATEDSLDLGLDLSELIGADIDASFDTENTSIGTGTFGVKAGYLHQAGVVVIGAELGVDVGDFSSEENSQLSIDVTVPPVDPADDPETFGGTITDNSTLSIDAIVKAQGKFGVAFDDGFLAYMTGGVAFAQASAERNVDLDLDLPEGFPIDVDFASDSSTDDLLIGPTFGVGMEKLVTSNISVGVEYNYTALGSIETGGIGIPELLGGLGLGGIGGIGGDEDDDDATDGDFDVNIHQVKGTLSYHF